MTATQGSAVVIGIDLGTSGLKAVAIDEGGSVLARATRGYETSRTLPGMAEQNPSDWIAAMHDALAEVAASVDPVTWSAIGLSAMLPTLVVLDHEFEPIGKAITWEDGRAEPQADAILAEFGEEFVYRATGQRLDGRYLLPMAQRVLAEGEVQPSHLIGAKDYLFLCLTGRLLTDPSTATGYGCFALDTLVWHTPLAAIVGRALLPEVADCSVSEPLDTDVASRFGCANGVPVVLGAADSVLGAYGLGVRSRGDIAVISGTSTVVIGCSEHPRLDPERRYLVTPMAGEGFGLELDLLATGSALAWLAELFGLGGAEDVVALAADVPLESAPIVLPYLAPGEQGALWDPTLTGLVQGLTLRTGRAEIARGLVAGIIIEIARCVALVREALDETPSAMGTGTKGVIRLSGSSGASSLFRQDLADSTGLSVLYDPNQRDHSALGAAQFAGNSALGWAPATRQAGIEVLPRFAEAAVWAERFERHERARLGAGS